ncbi:hypothetical protein ACHAQA_006855 [Verticillium albo-atrum]
MGDAFEPEAQPNAETPLDFAAVQARYAQEKAKRIRPDAADQYVELTKSDRLQSLASDPWVDHAALNAQAPSLRHGDDIKVLILGAGYGGLLYAIHFIRQGFAPSDIRLVDAAGGFGGTWYWNRFPGLMCDTEGYTYMPLLEETGHVPKHRFSYGPELLDYAGVLADKWDLKDKGVFRSTVRSYEWDAAAARWITEIQQGRGPGQADVEMTVRAQFVVVANGVLNHPKVPRSLQDFEGPTTHTARFDYGITGGSPRDQQLTKLRGKRVGIVGTGATAIQLIPELAKYAGELFVFQRTPSGVAAKGQCETQPADWATIADSPGWQKRRIETYCAVMAGEPGVEDTIRDGWTQAPAYKALIGGVHDAPLRMEDVPGHIGALLALDAPRTEAVRNHADEVVQDKATADALKAWYPTWCKRPTFSDGYLQTFNQPNVHLIDTDGKGVDKATAGGIVVAGKEYPIDILILSTGYRSPAAGLGEPGIASNMTIRGRDGVLLGDKWNQKGPSTLHGVLSNGFPNLFLSGPMQTGASANFSHVQNVLAEHCGYIAGEAIRRAVDKGAAATDKVVVENTVEAEETWAGKLMQRAAWFAGAGICTPNSNNDEGAMGADPASQAKMARGVPLALGMNAFARELKVWRDEGALQGIDVSF